MPRDPQKPRRLQGERVTLSPSEIADLADKAVWHRPAQPGLPDAQREGVWVHSFICNRCGLHFNVYSWQENRHRTATVYCPECGQHGDQFRHWRAQTSELGHVRTRADHEAFLNHPGEIYRFCPHPGSAPLDDMTMEGVKPIERLRW